MSEATSAAMESSDNGTDLSQDDTGGVKETHEETILSQQTSVNLVPYVGQRFVSQDAAYEFYCSFAKQCGFSIRRHRTRGKDGVGRGITRRDFTCHRGGYPQMKPSEDGKMHRNRKSSRCGCRAYMRIVKRADFDVPEWRVTGFSNVHNHELLKSNEVRLLPAYCTMSQDDKTRICMFSKAGMSVRQMLRLMELEKGLKLGSLPFTEVDVRNFLQSFRNVGHDYDPVDLLAMCKRKKDENPCFRYDFKLDGHSRVEHIGWCYASSVQLYESFGDAVLLDTTQRLDSYDMLLGVWIGMDNFGATCFFGCVLLRDESIESFSWALKTFLAFVNSKAPQTLLTDHNIKLKEAIATEMPETKHAICVWHIIARFSDWFSTLLGSHYDDWKKEFYHLYSLESVEEFEAQWKDVISKYGLHGNKHASSLYALRSYWALPFLRRYFFSGLLISWQTETVSGYIQRILSAQTCLDQFVDQVSEIVETTDRGGTTKQKSQKKSQKLCMKTGSPIECHAASVLTPYAFTKLQEELLLAPQYAYLLIEEGCFQVRHHTQLEGGCKVIWLPCQEHISCSCHHYEFSGILCRHVLRVLSSNNCFQIPDQYLPVRWRVNPFKPSAKDHSERIQMLESMTSKLLSESIESEERLDFACEQMGMVLSRVKNLSPPVQRATDITCSCPSDSLILPEMDDADGIHSYAMGNFHDPATLGKLKDRRLRDGGDVSRRRKPFSGACYGQYGHDLSHCQLLGSDSLNGDALGYL
ncbi:PREDICTED: protein FAR1-RELATED SEQUENCE 11-like [Tarenaya hassleriana]|uniref:protein FAR1-RELATED SEQUENCE 11-like n=1 Tax=Tarenaya hassleriana TaxID=28532 RepID=UPI00053C4538|nr:PREDICTED: protein FAR1-RELATED SEQUENCE 11-like [Tarenaya hassleriana]